MIRLIDDRSYRILILTTSSNNGTSDCSSVNHFLSHLLDGNLDNNLDDNLKFNYQYSYQFQEYESTLEIVNEIINEINKNEPPDCILLHWEPNNPNYEKLLDRLSKNLAPVVILVDRENERELIDIEEMQAGIHEYLIEQTLTRELLNLAIRNAIAQAKLNQKVAENKLLKHKLHLEQAVNLLIQSIHSSFDLSTIFTAATTGVGKLLKLDRVVINQYLPESEIWQPLVEYLDNPAIPALDFEIPDRHNLISLRLKQGEIVCINSSGEIDFSVNQVLAAEYPGSWLIAPLIVGTNIWGAISLNSHGQERSWQDIEIDLASNISTQLAIAIQQSLSHHNLSKELQKRDRTEMVLQERGSLLKAIFELSNVGIVVTDITGKFVRTNSSYQKMIGYSEIELESMNFAAFTHPEDLPENHKRFMAVVRGEQNGFSIEKRYHHRNGAYLWVRVNCFKINVPAGKTQLFIALIEDISDRKSAEINLEQLNQQLESKVKQRTSALQVSESRFKSFFDFAPIGIAVADVQTYQYVAVNNAFCQLLGYTEAELLESGTCATVSDATDWKLERPYAESMMRGEVNSYQIEKHYIKKNGGLILGELTATLIKDEVGNITNIVGMVRDISDQKRTAIALNQQMDRQQFLMNITQLIRQSLNLDEVLTTAVNEVKRLLNCDRVIIFQLFSDGVTKVVKEAVEPSYPAIINQNWQDEHFTNVGFDHYTNANIRIINDVAEDSWASCLSDFMQEAQVKSKIVAPIVQYIKASKDFNPTDNSNPTNKWQKGESQLWGLLIAHSCGELRQWDLEEAELLQQIANQLAIAIQQADLYQQVQNELATRKKFEHEMKTQAAADRLLSEVTVAINESINVDEALDLILKKVQEFLKCDRVQIFQLDRNFDGFVIKEEVSRPELAILGTMITDTCFTTTNLVEGYLRGKLTILPDILDAPNLTPCYVDLLNKYQIRANLAAPIIHSYQLWGLLIVHQCDAPREWLASEVNLVKQVAAQIGISAQKEKLYSRLIDELTQKKVLLKEIHHRVKNNLQVMSSLLRMQFRKTSPEVKTLAEEYQNRIQSMALIHDQLYRSDDLSHIDFHRYISNLTHSLFQCYGTNSELVNLTLQIDNILIPLDQSIPLGLIINELVSNALKHAFPHGFGRIVIQLIKLEHQYRLTVSDNGIGIPADFDLQNTNPLGMQLVESLTQQLEGEFTYNSKDGSIFQIDFAIL